MKVKPGIPLKSLKDLNQNPISDPKKIHIFTVEDALARVNSEDIPEGLADQVAFWFHPQN